MRAHEERTLRNFIDTTDVGNKRWEPPFVGEDWHAICQAIYKRIGKRSGAWTSVKEKERENASMR